MVSLKLAWIEQIVPELFMEVDTCPLHKSLIFSLQGVERDGMQRESKLFFNPWRRPPSGAKSKYICLAARQVLSFTGDQPKRIHKHCLGTLKTAFYWHFKKICFWPLTMLLKSLYFKSYNSVRWTSVQSGLRPPHPQWTPIWCFLSLLSFIASDCFAVVVISTPWTLKP